MAAKVPQERIVLEGGMAKVKGTLRDCCTQLIPRASHQDGRNVTPEPSLPSPEKYHFPRNLVFTHQRNSDSQSLGV